MLKRVTCWRCLPSGGALRGPLPKTTPSYRPPPHTPLPSVNPGPVLPIFPFAPVCVKDLVEKHNKTTLFKVTEVGITEIVFLIFFLRNCHCDTICVSVHLVSYVYPPPYMTCMYPPPHMTYNCVSAYLASSYAVQVLRRYQLEAGILFLFSLQPTDSGGGDSRTFS